MSDKVSTGLNYVWSLVTSSVGIAIFSYLAGFATAFIKPLFQWYFKKKEIALTNQFNNRKEIISRWRDELNKYDTLSDFYKTPLYNELVGHIPEKEMTDLLNNDTIEIILHIGTTTQDSRIIARFHKVISDKEKEWGII